MLKVLRTLKNLEDKNSDLYLKSILRVAEMKDIPVSVAEIKSQEHMNIYEDYYMPMLILEPCEFIKPKNFNDAEKGHTAKAILDMCLLLHRENKKNVLILNRSELIGKPLANMLLNNDFTPIIAHSKTNDIDKLADVSDIIVCATGSKLDINIIGKVVVDASGDIPYHKRTLASSYVGMGTIGELTTSAMLDGVEQ